MTLAEDLLLLAIDPNLHLVREHQQVVYGLMAADLAELAVARRVEVAGMARRIVVQAELALDHGSRRRTKIAGAAAS